MLQISLVEVIVQLVMMEEI